MFQTLELIAFTTAETALNAYLQRHPETLAQLASLEGKVIALHTQSPALDLYLLPNAQGIMLERGLAQPANVSVHGTCTALMGLLKKEASTGHLPPGVSLEGETHVLTKFKSILLDDALDM
ncbi:MAG: SCP2 sterol-binding domain-containing protein, partial [Pontibacterium sp.]